MARSDSARSKHHYNRALTWSSLLPGMVSPRLSRSIARDEQGQRLRDDQPADHGNAERLTQLRPDAGRALELRRNFLPQLGRFIELRV